MSLLLSLTSYSKDERQRKSFPKCQNSRFANQLHGTTDVIWCDSVIVCIVKFSNEQAVVVLPLGIRLEFPTEMTSWKYFASSNLSVFWFHGKPRFRSVKRRCQLWNHAWYAGKVSKSLPKEKGFFFLTSLIIGFIYTLIKYWYDTKHDLTKMEKWE